MFPVWLRLITKVLSGFTYYKERWLDGFVSKYATFISALVHCITQSTWFVLLQHIFLNSDLISDPRMQSSPYRGFVSLRWKNQFRLFCQRGGCGFAAVSQSHPNLYHVTTPSLVTEKASLRKVRNTGRAALSSTRKFLSGGYARSRCTLLLLGRTH